MQNVILISTIVTSQQILISRNTFITVIMTTPRSESISEAFTFAWARQVRRENKGLANTEFNCLY